MMYLTLADGTQVVGKIHHSRPEPTIIPRLIEKGKRKGETVLQKSWEHAPPKSITTKFILFKEGEPDPANDNKPTLIHFAEAEAFCNTDTEAHERQEQFRRGYGRKFAFERLLFRHFRGAQYRPDRMALWFSYFANFPQDRTIPIPNLFRAAHEEEQLQEARKNGSLRLIKSLLRARQRK